MNRGTIDHGSQDWESLGESEGKRIGLEVFCQS